MTNRYLDTSHMSDNCDYEDWTNHYKLEAAWCDYVDAWNAHFTQSPNKIKMIKDVRTLMWEKYGVKPTLRWCKTFVDGLDHALNRS